MPFNISQFNAEIAKTGIGKTSYFEGYVLPNSNIAKFGAQGLQFRIESLNLPGRTLQTIDQRYHGPVRQLPYVATYQPCSFTIILSKDYRERELFMRWQDFMVGHYRTGYNTNTIYPGMFDSKYYDEGVGEVEIKIYSNPLPNSPLPNNINAPSTNQSTPSNSGIEVNKSSFQTQYNVKLIEAFPISVTDMALGWGDEGYARLQVEMRYRFTQEQQYTFQNELTDLNRDATRKLQD